MENALYYTFSTIAQALAAAIALVTAFVLYRLQGIDTALREAGFTLLQGHLNNADLWNLHVRGDYEQFVALFSELNGPISPETNPERYAKFRLMQEECRVPAALLPPFRHALFLSAIVMGASVIFLCIAPQIANCQFWLPQLVLSLGAVGFIGCLIMYFFLIMQILDSR